ncbi:MAG TPA: DUF6790 family protein [Candidatus Baltobacteraceae bacterium]|nr:DUF6790 family protein [Candidatus Baltobacteraceae bacterium]
MIANAIAAILSNWFLALFVVALCTTYAKVRRARSRRERVNVAGILWGELLLYSVGISMAYGGIFHAYFATITAPAIGWQPSPFEYELGWMEIPVGIVAIASMWRGLEFRIASTTIFVIFSLAAAAQHVEQILCCKNFAPNNAGVLLWFGDIFLPLLIVTCALLARHRD